MQRPAADFWVAGQAEVQAGYEYGADGRYQEHLEVGAGLEVADNKERPESITGLDLPANGVQIP